MRAGERERERERERVEKLSLTGNMHCNKVKADEEGIYMINSEHMIDSHAVSKKFFVN
jgi:hypothetical protein